MVHVRRLMPDDAPVLREIRLRALSTRCGLRHRRAAAGLIGAVREAAEEAGAEAIGLHVFEGNDRARRVY